MGGEDAGPEPMDFLLAGLGACTSITLRMYAERKDWPLTGVSVELTHDRLELDGPRHGRSHRRA
jgi:putative redox protein